MNIHKENRIDYVTISYNFSSMIDDGMTDPEYINSICASINGYLIKTEDEKKLKDIQLGKIQLYRIHVENALNDGINLLDLYDEKQETMDVASVLFDASLSEFKPNIKKMFLFASPYKDILIINRVEILPFARKSNLGAGAIYRVIRDFGSGCSMVVIKAFPLQFEVEANQGKNWKLLELDQFSQNERAANKSLGNYYKRIGFKRIKNTPFYAISLESRWREDNCILNIEPIYISMESIEKNTLPQFVD